MRGFWFALMLAAAAQSALAADRPFAWPHGARAAVSLAYDDAIDSQLDNAIPALDKVGLKGSFYLTLSSETLVTRLAEWRKAAANGHELGNHTLFHQCSRKAPGHEWVAVENDLDETSVAQLAQQIRVGNSMLHAIDGKTERTFTVPCGDLLAEGVDYLPAIKSEFVAIKSGDGGVVPDMDALDPYSVGVEAPGRPDRKAVDRQGEGGSREGNDGQLHFPRNRRRLPHRLQPGAWGVARIPGREQGHLLDRYLHQHHEVREVHAAGADDFRNQDRVTTGGRA